MKFEEVAKYYIERRVLRIMPKIIECIYENGMFKPLEKVELKGGKKVKILLREDREDILDKYAGIVKIGRFARIEDILESEGETWLY